MCLLQAFRVLSRRDDLPWNLVYLASAEEEVSGRAGIESVIPLLPPISCAIVGEPTGMQPAVAEKGLAILLVNRDAAHILSADMLACDIKAT